MRAEGTQKTRLFGLYTNISEGASGLQRPRFQHKAREILIFSVKYLP